MAPLSLSDAEGLQLVCEDPSSHFTSPLLLSNRIFLRAAYPPCLPTSFPAQHQETKAAFPAGLCGRAHVWHTVTRPDSWPMSCHKVPPTFEKKSDCPIPVAPGPQTLDDSLSSAQRLLFPGKTKLPTHLMHWDTWQNCFSLHRYSCKTVPQWCLTLDLLPNREAHVLEFRGIKAVKLLQKSLICKTGVSRQRKRQLQKWSKKLGQT